LPKNRIVLADFFFEFLSSSMVLNSLQLVAVFAIIAVERVRPKRKDAKRQGFEDMNKSLLKLS